MAADNSVLQFSTASAGLQRLYLLENTASYRVLDQMGEERPPVVMAIGGKEKRRFLSNFFINYLMVNYSLALKRWPGQNSKLLLDCELHLSPKEETPQIVEARQHSQWVHHPLKGVSHDVEVASFGLYRIISSNLCDITLIFISDIGSMSNVVHLLSRWVLSAMTEEDLTPTEIFLILNELGLYSADALWHEIAASVLSKKRSSELHMTSTLAEIKQFSRRCFRIRFLTQEELYKCYCSNALATPSHRKELGLEFSAIQWKFLFRSAIAQYASQPFFPFNIIAATRISYPLPKKLVDNITGFVQACSHQGINSVRVIASALVLDAFPSNMPAFVPGRVYDRVYSKPMQACGIKTGLPNLSCEIRKEFQLVAADARKDIMKKHCNNIQSCTGISNIYIHHACSLCLVQNPTITLDCTYFIITLFIEKWTFAACKNRLQDVKKFKAKKDKVSFSRNLTWQLKKLQHSSTINAAILGGKTFQLALSNTRADCLTNPDVIIQCGDESFTRSYVESMSSSEGKERKALICTKSVLESCRNYRPFYRQLRVATLSLNSAISIRMDGIDGNKHCISNCPYPLKKLILDQGLETPFGSRQHNSLFSNNKPAKGERKLVDLEIDALVTTLN
ncbi:hypothetical protein ACQKWADRAFT_325915 [Trichoderma austrokoningii]